MIKITKTLDAQPDSACICSLLPRLDQAAAVAEQILFFDIETTGFSPKGTVCYLIGAVYCRKNTWQYTQWFARTPSAEPDMLHAFFEFTKAFRYLVHFNGNNFDLPYLDGRCRQLGIPNPLSGLASIDLYQQARAAGKLLNLDNYKQKTLEAFFGVIRKDLCSGKELIQCYRQYVSGILLHENTEALKERLLLHNHEDICALPFLTPVLGYAGLCNGNGPVGNCPVQVKDTKDDAGVPVQDALFTAELPSRLPVAVSYKKGPYDLTASDNMLCLRVRMHTGELKYFYPNYRDYYYLPAEDRAIHKSVAFYVDKHFRTQAKAANCYSKKSGLFLPQPTPAAHPYFKTAYNDAQTYFEADADFLSDEGRRRAYLQAVLRDLL